MKKLFSILLCTAMVFSLAACGSANSSNTPAASTAPAASAANPASGADTQAETTAWAPTKDVEIVTHSGVGSGGDVIGRAIIESCKGIVDANMFMQNKKGSAGSAILCLLVVGSLALNEGIFAVGILIVCAFLGYLMKLAGFNPIATVLGFVLSQLVEDNLHRTMLLSKGSLMTFVEHPITLALLVLTVASVVFGLVKGRKKEQKA